ncbi:ABC transporter permease [Shouchella shacheensis]|uniref:ABC transporter permease n=1 Tax=Shouchella shacheensis TaxID=1649580 RepID=UPI0007405402|nr:ABC transporter permease [Shouchella shacheensis]
MNAVTAFLSDNGAQLLTLTWQHLYISVISITLGIMAAIPLGVALTRVPKVANGVIGLVSILQTVPSLAILAFFIPILGVGTVPAIIALFIYSVLPILRNTYTGVKNIDRDLLESARGMGMTGWQRIISIELPLAVPIIMAGIRVSSVYLIGWATLAAFIGAGGLGDFIFSGLNLYQPEFIIGGAIPVTLLALLVDFVFGRAEKGLTPKGIRNEESA